MSRHHLTRLNSELAIARGEGHRLLAVVGEAKRRIDSGALIGSLPKELADIGFHVDDDMQAAITSIIAWSISSPCQDARGGRLRKPS